jgi:tetratricopeptide (TPR) repeat protein
MRTVALWIGLCLLVSGCGPSKEEERKHLPPEQQLQLEGEDLIERKDYEGAIEVYRKLIVCDPNNADYYCKLGQLLAWTRRWDESEKVLYRCLDIQPDNADALVQLGYLALWQKRYDEAIEMFTQAVNKYPDYRDAHIGLEKALKEKELSQKQPSPHVSPS